jgi:Bacteriophage head to tail connecting protein
MSIYNNREIALSYEDDSALYYRSIIDDEKLSRSGLTAKWLEMWDLYKTQPIKVRDNDGWKSKLNDGRVFEMIETVSAYIRNAMFFSDRWLELESNDEELAEILPLVSALVCDKLNLSNFKEEFSLFLVQYLLLGFSAIIPYWDTDADCIAFECINAYDVYIESSRRYNQRFSYSFRDVYLNKAEFISWAEDGALELPTQDLDEEWNRLAQEQVKHYPETRNTTDVCDFRQVLVTEFHSPEEGKLFRLIDNEIMFEEEVDRCPWLICSLYDTPQDAYALSLIDSSIGLVLANNILHNRRLDNIALSIDNMWLFVDDGVTNPDDITTAPGKILKVATPDTLQPLRPPANNFGVTYDEGTVLDAKIDRNVGTGAMISANSYRQGERVTKAEIDGVKDAGGNRLTDLFERVEHRAILPILRRAYLIIAESVKGNQKVKLKSERPGVYDFFKVYPSDLSKDYTVKIVGTQSVINRDRNISLITDFITLVANVPQFQPMIDFKNLYFDLLTKFGFDDPSRYMVKETPESQAAAVPQSPLQQLGAKAQEIGGDPMAAAVQQMTATGGAVQAVNALGGISPQTTDGMTPQDETAALMALTTPQQ